MLNEVDPITLKTLGKGLSSLGFGLFTAFAEDWFRIGGLTCSIFTLYWFARQVNSNIKHKREEIQIANATLEATKDFHKNQLKIMKDNKGK